MRLYDTIELLKMANEFRKRTPGAKTPTPEELELQVRGRLPDANPKRVSETVKAVVDAKERDATD